MSIVVGQHFRKAAFDFPHGLHRLNERNVLLGPLNTCFPIAINAVNFLLRNLYPSSSFLIDFLHSFYVVVIMVDIQHIYPLW